MVNLLENYPAVWFQVGFQYVVDNAISKQTTTTKTALILLEGLTTVT